MRNVNQSQQRGLWQLYATTCFVVSQGSGWGGEFAIITACNPHGQLLSAGANGIRDRQLQQRLQQWRVAHLRVVGAAPDLSHQERSWAVWVDEPQALALAAELGQNAIYYVSHDQLWLLPCLMAGERRALGRFRERLRLDEQG
ncbi:MAG: DUF3293 domain-containing protein [Corallincola sp.]|nr:DUF3293 domain-containing protein [Corallincola sp.]